MASMVGAAVLRKEDPALLTGRGRYVDDILLPGMVHMAYVRSVQAHARIVAIDTRAALALPGVVAVLTGSDIRAVARTDRLVVALPDRTYKQQRDRAILATDDRFMRLLQTMTARDSNS